MKFCATFKGDGVIFEDYVEYEVSKIMADTLPDYGGMIVVSIDVNAIDDPDQIQNKNWLREKVQQFKTVIRNKYKTWQNKLHRHERIDQAVKDVSKEKGVSTGWSIGKLFKGRFYDSDTDVIYNEDSLAIDIRGVPYEFIREVAKNVAKMFDQKSVMVVNYETNKTELVSA